MALNSVNVFKGALVSTPATASSFLTDNSTVIPFQYNPENMQRSVKPNMAGGESQDRTLAVMYKGPPVQTITIVIEFDASTGLENGDETELKHGVYAQLAALELLLTPTTKAILKTHKQLTKGQIEITPFTTPNIYFVWGPSRVLPVKIENYSVDEQGFDVNLNPIKANVTLNLTVLNCSDVAQENQAYSQYITYQQNMEEIAKSAYSSDWAKINKVK